MLVNQYEHALLAPWPLLYGNHRKITSFECKTKYFRHQQCLPKNITQIKWWNISQQDDNDISQLNNLHNRCINYSYDTMPTHTNQKSTRGTSSVTSTNTAEKQCSTWHGLQTQQREKQRQKFASFTVYFLHWQYRKYIGAFVTVYVCNPWSSYGNAQLCLPLFCLAVEARLF